MSFARSSSASIAMTTNRSDWGTDAYADRAIEAVSCFKGCRTLVRSVALRPACAAE